MEDKMSSGRGTGRGEIYKRLLERRQTSADELTPQSSARIDSGFNESHERSSGRGRLISALSESNTLSQLPSSDSESLGRGGGRGRAQLIQKLVGHLSEDPNRSGSFCSSTNSPPVGRGKLLQSFSAAGTSAVKEGLKIVEVTEKLETVQISEKKLDTPEPVLKHGKKGTTVEVQCNYIRLYSDPDKGVFEYEVKFEPNIESKGIRSKYLTQLSDTIGETKTFDGVTLFLPIQLKDRITQLTTPNFQDDTQTLHITIIFKKKKELQNSIHFYNVLFHRIMRQLNYVQISRKQYDPTSPHIIPQHNLEIWPGYVTAVDEYEGGIMLCCDISHKILYRTTAYQVLHNMFQASRADFQVQSKKALLGSVVLTRYNNKTYRIDDINFNLNPMSKFSTKSGEITYYDYYKRQYNIIISDIKQPLLISMAQRRVSGKDEPEELTFALVPELCYLTGLHDDNKKVVRDIATYTRVTPNQRIEALEKFYHNINNCKEAHHILNVWGLRLPNEIEKLNGRQLPEETIQFARKQFSAGRNADFGNLATSNELLEVVPIKNWILIYTRNDTRYAQSFMDCVERNCRPMGITVSKPTVHVLNADRNDDYVNALRHLITDNVQIVVLICPTSRDDRYAAIKKICCSEIPVPSQVINAHTLKNEAKNRSIVQKIMLQINCKLGGTLWSVKIPFQKVMICGIDSYHDAKKSRNSVSAFVASLNGTYTKWYSRAIIQTKKEELVNGLVISLKFALQAYENKNKFLPDKIIIFRDGVGDGQLKVCKDFELPQLKEAYRATNPKYEPQITFIVVQKRINTRIFMNSPDGKVQNPTPGLIVDHTITRKFLYDFFLVSQNVRQGTVSPTHFVVVDDANNFSPDILQQLSYKLCFLYYNWPGTVRVPACCQYAHKLAFLVGQSVERPTSEKLANKLFYL